MGKLYHKYTNFYKKNQYRTIFYVQTCFLLENMYNVDSIRKKDGNILQWYT